MNDELGELNVQSANMNDRCGGWAVEDGRMIDKEENFNSK